MWKNNQHISSKYGIIYTISYEGENMLSMQNKVVNGDYLGCKISNVQNKMLIIENGRVNVPISKRTVEDYVVVSSDTNKNTANTIKRTLVGGVLAGGIGAIVGSATAKNNITHKIMIKFKDKKSSLIEIDDNYYGILTMSLF